MEMDELNHLVVSVCLFFLSLCLVHSGHPCWLWLISLESIIFLQIHTSRTNLSELNICPDEQTSGKAENDHGSIAYFSWSSSLSKLAGSYPSCRIHAVVLSSMPSISRYSHLFCGSNNTWWHFNTSQMFHLAPYSLDFLGPTPRQARIGPLICPCLQTGAGKFNWAL